MCSVLAFCLFYSAAAKVYLPQVSNECNPLKFLLIQTVSVIFWFFCICAAIKSTKAYSEPCQKSKMEPSACVTGF